MLWAAGVIQEHRADFHHVLALHLQSPSCGPHHLRTHVPSPILTPSAVLSPEALTTPLESLGHLACG